MNDQLQLAVLGIKNAEIKPQLQPDWSSIESIPCLAERIADAITKIAAEERRHWQGSRLTIHPRSVRYHKCFLA